MSKRIKSIENRLGIHWIGDLKYHGGADVNNTLTYHTRVLFALLDYLKLEIQDGMHIIPRQIDKK